MLSVDIKEHGYNGKTIIHNIKYDFSPNKIHGIIGPNGSGKSTLLKVATGLEVPVDGQVTLNDKKLTTIPAEIACCWQRPYLFRGTVRFNLEYPLKIHKWAKEKREARIQEVIKKYKIDHLIDRNIIGLSGGEQARVAIARAVVSKPEILILDEPSAAMDPKNVMFVESLLHDLRESTDLTIIMVTHNMFQAKRIADETLFLVDGTIVEAGPTEVIFESPQHEETRQFITGEFIF